jgi:hypothetical protein
MKTMKNTKKNMQCNGMRRSLQGLAFSTALCFGLASGNALADTEMEYEAGEGYHEEEWYDPSDWFNEDNQTSYETENSLSEGNWDDTYYPHRTGYYYWDSADQNWNDQESAQQTVSNQQKKNNRNTARFDGTIDGFKKVSLIDRKGVKDDHTFVKVSLKNGQSRIVSLGNSKDLGDLDLSKGDKISVSGQMVKLDGKKIILADTLRSGGDSHSFAGSNQPNLKNRSGQAAHAGMVTRSGTLEDATKVKLDKQKRDENLIVRLEMEDGTSCVADLGPNTTMEELNLDEGDTVWIKGKKRQINGKTLIVAKQLRIDGRQQGIRDSDSK